MPNFEMPLDQLRSYKGRNPRPADFDAYWDRALSELDATNPQAELVPHPSPATFAECFDLWFTGVGQARIHAQYVRPRSAGPHPAPGSAEKSARMLIIARRRGSPSPRATISEKR